MLNLAYREPVYACHLSRCVDAVAEAIEPSRAKIGKLIFCLGVHQAQGQNEQEWESECSRQTASMIGTHEILRDKKPSPSSPILGRFRIDVESSGAFILTFRTANA